MRRGLLSALLIAGVSAPALADCRAEVMEALEKQRTSGAFRMETQMLGEQGPMKMVVDYKLPDRVHQTVTVVINPVPVETILVGDKAWINDGKGWSELGGEQAKELADQVKQTVGQSLAPDLGSFACLGTVVVDGRELISYRSEDDAPKDEAVKEIKHKKTPEELAKEKEQQEKAPVRMFFIDPATGLPARTTYALKNKLDKPFFKAVYSYPKDIKIEPPAKVEAPAKAEAPAKK